MNSSSKGFSFAEILIVVAIMGIIASVALKNLTGANDKTKYEESILELQKLKEAIIGEENARSNNERVNFGFIGDIGGLPSSLDDLMSIGSLGAASIDTAKLIAYGWMGPYLDVPFTGNNSDFKIDGWGNAYIYSTIQFANGPGDTVFATISSLGADGAVGGTGYDSDISVEIHKDQVLSDLTGCVFDVNGDPVVNATIRIYHSDGNGILTSTLDITNSSGCYEVQNVSQGIRSFTIHLLNGIESEGYRATLGGSFVTIRDIADIGTIILVGIPVATGPNGEDLDFVIQNKLGEDITINDFSVVYTPFDGLTGPRYGSMKIGGPTAWSAAATGAGSGDLLSTLNTFSAATLNDNQSKSISLDDFQDNVPADINIFGATFTATFFASDGAQYVVGPFIAGGNPTLQLIGTAGTQGAAGMSFDVKNNTGGDIIITDMLYVYTPFDAGTGPKFNQIKFGNSTAYSEASFSTGSNDLLSTIGTFTNTSILNGETVSILTNTFKNDKNKNQNQSGSEFTVTFFTSTTSYVIGPMIVQ